MEELLFYQYLEYQKNHSPHFIQRFLKLPLTAKTLFASTLLSGLIGTLLLLKKSTGWAALAVLAECACSFFFEFYMEHFKTIQSKIRTEDRFIEWLSLKDWLATTPASDSGKILEIKDRTEKYIKDELAYRKAKLDQFEKWVQFLAFPLVLAIAQRIINEQSDTSIIIAIALTIFTVCGMLYGAVKLAISLWSFAQVRRLKQMSLFAEDLQGVLDLEKFRIERVGDRDTFPPYSATVFHHLT